MRKLTPKRYPLHAVRALSIRAQGLGKVQKVPVTPDRIYDVIEKIGCIQLDTLQMVQRSQYLVLWSRLGNYVTGELDDMLSGGPGSGNGRRLYEYWRHAACLIPLTDYRFSLPLVRKYREGIARWRRNWIEDATNRDLVERVLARVRENGPVRSADFDRQGPKRGTWWDWKPAKIALEHLYNVGDLMVSSRKNFQRIYDLKERVLPAWVDQNEPKEAEAMRHVLEGSLLSLGVSELGQVADYSHTKRTVAKPVLEALVHEGVFVSIQADLADGGSRSMVVHRDHVRDLEKAADREMNPDQTTFLSPFDNLFWARGRDQQFWGFDQVLEAYKPSHARRWGYFCLAILHGDRLVGRFDPKMDRKTGTLVMRKLYIHSKDVSLDSLAHSMGSSMRDFMDFHNATNLVVDHSEPPEFRGLLTQAM